MNVSELYDHIFLEGSAEVPVRVAVSKEQYASLRVSLSRIHRTMKASDLTQESLCARFDAETGHASFWIGRRRVSGVLSFTLLTDEDGTQI